MNGAKKDIITNAFSITLLPQHTTGERSSEKVHVIPGGGKGAPVIHALIQKGLSVSAGVVNTLDTDYYVAQYFGIECAVEAPFSPISSEVDSRNANSFGRQASSTAEYLLRAGELKEPQESACRR